MTFSSTDNATIHGFAGYFDARLYKDVHISINPQTHSDGMFSWFPIMFPIRVCIYRHCMHINICLAIPTAWRSQ